MQTLHMTTEPRPTPKEHLEARVAAGPIRVNDQRRLDHPSFVTRLNAKLGLKVTTIVGTMWAAYLFAMIALVALPSAISSHNLVTVVFWLSSSFLQLVLLPIIIVGQNIQAKAADARAEATYNDAAAILEQAITIQAHLLEQDTHLQRQEEHLAQIVREVANLEKQVGQNHRE